MVASHADWWFLDYDKDAADAAAVAASLGRSIAAMKERARRVGRTVRFAFNPFVAFGRTRDEALAEAQRLLSPTGPGFDERKVASRVGPAMKAGCIGTPREVRDQLERYADMGVELFLFKMAPSVEGARGIAGECHSPFPLEHFPIMWRRNLRRRDSCGTRLA